MYAYLACETGMPKPPSSAQRLPDLDLLKGFEAAARHMSFTRAGEELFLTQSALSRQMQTLEEQIGVPLFERRHRSLRLTEAGQLLQVAARSVLDQLGVAVARLRREQAVRPLTISTAIPFAALWLLPRLPRFRQGHPDVDVFISADNRIVDLDRERIDLAVRYCPESMAPRDATRLFGERLQPVCSPALASDPTRPLKRPEDLALHVLLNLDDDRGRYPWLNWTQWFAAIGIPEPRPAGLIRFNQYDLLVRAAIDGQGVALGRSPLIDQLVAQGTLVAPFRRKHSTSRAYFVVRAAQAERRPEAQTFIDWLREEAREEATEPEASDVRPRRQARRRTATAPKPS
jgi:LysR family transcriptional regulator, glycine cleavage system transcriptional activator